MKHIVIYSGVLLLAGCVSGPRPYDGVLGYRTESVQAGLQVTYIDEAKVSAERTRVNISKVCSTKLDSALSASSVQVQSETSFEQQVSMSIQIPVGVQNTGSHKAGSGQGPGAVMKSSVSQTESVMRTMKLKKTLALCSKAP